MEKTITEITIDEDLVYVPGDRVCPECNFRLHQRVLRASDGAVGVNDKEGETCPNDGHILNRLTWRQEAQDANRAALDLLKERKRYA